MAVDRGGRDNRRQMRAFQKLAADAIGSLALIEGSGISFVGDTISVDLKDTDPGLSFHATGLQLLIAAGQPFSLGSGLNLNLTTNGGLELAAGTLGVALAPDPGLALGATGLAVAIAANEPFSLTGGLALALTTDGGLATTTGTLGVTLNPTASGLTTAGGLAVVPGPELEINGTDQLDGKYPPGRFTDISILTSGAFSYAATPGEIILLDSTAFSNQSIKLPDPTLYPGEHITLKVVNDADVTVLITAQQGNDYTGRIEGFPPNTGGTSFMTMVIPNGSVEITSDGVDWWFTSIYKGLIDMSWRRYEIKDADMVFTSGTQVGTIGLFSVVVNVLNTVVFMGAFIHTAQGWFTFKQGEVDIDLKLVDSSSPVPRYLIPTHTVFPQTFNGSTGRSPLEAANLTATGTVTVSAEFTVRGGASATIDDVNQGRSTVWILWGNLGPRFP